MAKVGALGLSIGAAFHGGYQAFLVAQFTWVLIYAYVAYMNEEEVKVEETKQEEGEEDKGLPQKGMYGWCGVGCVYVC